MSLNSKTYQNVMLTAIAVLLLVLAAQMPVRLDVAQSAYAREKEERYGGEGTKTEAMIARANQDIASSIDGVAKAIDDLGKAVNKMAMASMSAASR